MAVVGDRRPPPERVIVPILELVSPVPAVGLPATSSGGHAVAHAPAHALLVPESALNRYRVRPVELTRIDPRLLFATPTVAEAPLEDFGVAAVAALPPPPHTAMARAASGITAALTRKVMGLGLLRVMSLRRLGRSTVAAAADARITQRVVSTGQPRSQGVGTGRAGCLGASQCSRPWRAGGAAGRRLKINAARFTLGANIRRCPPVASYSLRASRSWEGCASAYSRCRSRGAASSRSTLRGMRRTRSARRRVRVEPRAQRVLGLDLCGDPGHGGVVQHTDGDHPSVAEERLESARRSVSRLTMRSYARSPRRSRADMEPEPAMRPSPSWEIRACARVMVVWRSSAGRLGL